MANCLSVRRFGCFWLGLVGFGYFWRRPRRPHAPRAVGWGRWPWCPPHWHRHQNLGTERDMTVRAACATTLPAWLSHTGHRQTTAESVSNAALSRIPPFWLVTKPSNPKCGQLREVEEENVTHPRGMSPSCSSQQLRVRGVVPARAGTALLAGRGPGLCCCLEAWH